MPENPGSANIVLRNILVGLITTVLGAIILYFLGFRDRNAGSKATQEENLLAKREATIQAWKSYVTAENLLLQNFNTFSANFSLARFDEYKKLALAEVDRFNADLKKILGYKNLDPSMVSLLERRLRDKESWLVKYKAYLGNYQRIATALLSDDEKNKSLENESYRFQNDVKDLDQKFANEIAGLCKVLTEKNNYNFAWTDLLLFQPPPANTAAVTNTTLPVLPAVWHPIQRECFAATSHLLMRLITSWSVILISTITEGSTIISPQATALMASGSLATTR